TSGDTGGAVGAAFHDKPNVEVIILYPKGKISPRQEKQLTSWGKNIRAFSVNGDFDACQKMVKEALQSDWWKKNKKLISANSISLARLLPQMVFYAGASTQYFNRTKQKPGFIIPTGNLGNSVAAFWAKKMGFPIGQIILATNANRAIPDYFASGKWKEHPTIETLANAMDVGNPSNIERLISLYPNPEDLKKDAASISVTDNEIRQTIQEGEKNWGEVWCPHTATAIFAREKIKDGHWIAVATAHPAKFETIVEPLIKKQIEIPDTLQEILSKPSHYIEIDSQLSELEGKVL
ncbi:MAG: threonine synthase, partial [Bacteriovoracaceae bacterium]|nr:threonine synthase [Bacteriovoracaceae bacterium]